MHTVVVPDIALVDEACGYYVAVVIPEVDTGPADHAADVDQVAVAPDSGCSSFVALLEVVVGLLL